MHQGLCMHTGGGKKGNAALLICESCGFSSYPHAILLCFYCHFYGTRAPKNTKERFRSAPLEGCPLARMQPRMHCVQSCLKSRTLFSAFLSLTRDYKRLYTRIAKKNVSKIYYRTSCVICNACNNKA